MRATELGCLLAAVVVGCASGAGCTSVSGLSSGADAGAADAGVDAPAPDVGVPDAGADGRLVDAGSDAPLDASLGCPDAQGPLLVNAGTTCIDATEVTVDDYAAFLAAKPQTGKQPAFCTWNTTFVPAPWPLPANRAKHPIAKVDWCDAYAYCAWAGKHLCGKVGGGASPPSQAGDPSLNGWGHGCGGPTTLPYPYGTTYDPTACNGPELDAGDTVPVGSMLACTGGYNGMYDMTGNVEEWSDTCEAMSGAADVCYTRGGSLYDTPAQNSCGYAVHYARNYLAEDVGIRCCWP